MARNQRGRRRNQEKASRAQRPSFQDGQSRVRKGRDRSRPDDGLPVTSSSGIENQAPATSGVFGGSVAGPVPALPRRPQIKRQRGGPRERDADRQIRRIDVVHDFRYIVPDMRWIGITTVFSLAFVILFFIVLRTL